MEREDNAAAEAHPATMIKGLHLVSIVVPELDQALAFFRDAMGLEVDTSVADPHHALRLAHVKVGHTALALMQPLDQGTPVGRFLQRQGSALYHVALEVDDIEYAMRTLLARGAELLDREPRDSETGRIAFVRPKGLRSVLIELWEPRTDAASVDSGVPPTAPTPAEDTK